MAAAAKSPVPWPNTQSDYKLLDVIGIGATAVVYSAECLPREEKCAIKRINLEKWNTSMDELLKEIQAMSSCSHENVVTYYTSFVVADELWLVLKLLEGGSLLDVIKHKMRVTNCKHGVFDEATIATVLREVLKGLEYFHSNGQIHRDIKAGNILLGEDGTVQIADFGVSSWLATGRDSSRQKVRHTFVGTPCWMAPEVMEQVRADHGYDFKADIWSIGITAIEMASGTAPYHKYPPMKVLMLTLQNEPPSLETGADEKDQYKAYGKTFRKMVNECLQKDPTKRPSASELLKHPFFKKAKDKKYLTQTIVAIGPSMETRVHKANRQQHGTTGRLHRTVTGEWVWCEADEPPQGAATSVEATPEAGTAAAAYYSDDEIEMVDDMKPMNELLRADSSGSENEENYQKQPISTVELKTSLEVTSSENITELKPSPEAQAKAETKSHELTKPQVEKPPADKLPAEKPPADKLPADKLPAEKPPAEKPPAEKPPTETLPTEKLPVGKPTEKPTTESPSADAKPVENAVMVPQPPFEKPDVSLVLRLRNGRRELNDIQFEFVMGKDTPEGIASELVNAGLVEPDDSVPIALNLTRLLNAQLTSKNAPNSITFHLNSTGPNEEFDDKALIGFAQMSIVD